MAGALIVLLLAGAAFVGTTLQRSEGAPRAEQSSTRCLTPAVPLRVVTSPDKTSALQRLAAEFAKTEPSVDGRCVDVTVSEQLSATIASRLVDDKDPAELGEMDVWMPESQLWLRSLATAKSPGVRLLADNSHPSVAQSPAVFAMPRPMAEALGWPEQKLALGDILALAAAPTGWAAKGHPEWGAFRLDETDPRVSTAKAQTAVAVLYSRVGPRPSAALVATPAVVGDLLGMGRAPGPTMPDTESLLAGWREADSKGKALQFASAVALDEKSVVDYNRGVLPGTTGAAASTDDDPQPPKVPLAAIYPSDGSLVSDHPFVVTTTDAARRAAASAFLGVLTAAPGQQELQRHGFRGADGTLPSATTGGDGVLADQPIRVLPLPSAGVVPALMSTVQRMQVRTRLLTLLDVSGSMDDPARGARTTKLDVARGAALGGLTLFADRDHVGLWIFSSELSGASPYREVVPVGALKSAVAGTPRRVMVQRSLKSLRARGATGLYDSTWAAYQRMERGFSPQMSNTIVLLTDGRNEAVGGLSLAGLVKRLKAADAKKPIQIVTIAFGADADHKALQQISAATGGASYRAESAADIQKIYVSSLARNAAAVLR